MPRQRTACNICATIKQKCSGECPCSRCQRLSIPCTYGSAHSSPRPSDEKRTRSQHSRSTHGCVNCIKRRRKCDEAFPACSDCERLGLLCAPRPIKRHDANIVLERSTKASREGQKDLGPVTSSPETTRNSPSNDLVAAFSPDSGYSPVPILYEDWIALIDNDRMPELARRGNLKDSSALRRRHQRLDFFPSYAAYTALDDITGVMSEHLQDWLPTERHLLSHFLQVVSRALSSVEDNANPFLTLIVPMTLTHLSVRHALLALATCHLYKVYPDFGEALLNYTSQALQALKEEIDSGTPIETALATTLMLCMLEIFEGNSRKWILHLHGARALLDRSAKAIKAKPAVKFLCELFEFLCCITSVTSGMIPTLSDMLSKSTTLPLVDESSQRRIHPIFGVARDLYGLLYHVNELAAQKANRYASTQSNRDFLMKADHLRGLLENWSGGEHGMDRWDLREAQAAAVALQWATILRLRQVVHGPDLVHPTVQSAVHKILLAISRIRPGSKAETRILFPLFMAGVGSINKTNRLTVEYRLNALENTIGMGNITAIHLLLDTVWKRTNEEQEDVDWEDIMQKEFSGVVFF